ncbi:MAG: hypothetical protein VYD01_00665, partial [Pseudomonadota bacterium]|nr:hypothetical protein [Pseudomonadota bacterium]
EWIAAIGMGAAHRGDLNASMAASDRLRILSENAEVAGTNYLARQTAVLEQEVTAVRLMKGGDMDGAIAAAKNAAEMERQYLRVPSGPPKPMKPAGELYADMLLAANRPAEAVSAYQQSLQWIPQRTPSMRGLAKAAEMAGDEGTAREMMVRLKEMPGANLMD